VLIVAGLSLRNLEPRVWDEDCEYFLPRLRAVMVSYADFQANTKSLEEAKSRGIRRWLGVPSQTKVFLDNGSFYFLRTGQTADCRAYRDFVRSAKPDWYPIPFDSIPTPAMSASQQNRCFEQTMRVNCAHHHDGYVPVIHAGAKLEQYLKAVKSGTAVKKKTHLAIGGMVPNLLRAPKAPSYERVLECLTSVAAEFPGKRIHVFGIGGTATVHLAALLGFRSADSSGWRNRAARGIVQLPGHGERIVANLGKWRGREPNRAEGLLLKKCVCPACRMYGLSGLKASGLRGFCNRATHNLHVLLEEANWVEKRLDKGTYSITFRRRLQNSTYLPIIEQVIRVLNGEVEGTNNG
jgi:7-cyano-7-deazaguanine tRNA-ribosyltransferase